MSGRLDAPRQRSRAKPLEATTYTLPTPNWYFREDMRRYLEKRGLSNVTAKANGWYPSTEAGDSELRIVIPCYGEIVKGFWQARSIQMDTSKRWQSPHGLRGDAVAVVYPSGTGARVVIVEGPMCALAAAELDYLGIALLGATPSKAAINLTARLCHGKLVTLVSDSDKPDLMAALVPAVAELSNGVRLIIPGETKDLADLEVAKRRSLLEW